MKLIEKPRSFFRACIWRAQAAISNARADFYISDAVKVIIAVVLGALLLAAITLLFNDTILPRITKEITNLFS